MQSLKNGGFVMVMDSLERENECDLVIAAETCTTEKMAFMIRQSTGIVCVVSNRRRLEKMHLHPATGCNTDKNGTNFYVSFDYTVGTTTGCCAADRVASIRAMSQETLNPDEFSKPGHMFPLCAKEGGVLEREGHTESAYDLCRLANLTPVAAIAELMHEDGSMFRYPDSLEFARTHNIPLITVQDIIDARKTAPIPVSPVAPLPSHVSQCTINVQGIDALCSLQVRDCGVGKELVILWKGDVRGKSNVPTRIHSECFTGDTLGSERCDCGQQLAKFKQVMNGSECAILAYYRGHEGRGIGLANKIACYHLQDVESLDTVDANIRLGFDIDARSYADITQILSDNIGVKSIKLYTNNPTKVGALKDLIESTEKLISVPTERNIHYLQTKVQRMGHATELSTFKLPIVPIEKAAGRESTVAIVSTAWNEYYVKPIVEQCVQWLKENNNVRVVCRTVPGALDLVSGARNMSGRRKADVVIVIGMLIQGASDTYHNSCAAVQNGIATLNATQDVPVISQVLMVKNDEQAKERAFHEDLGRAVATSALAMLTMWTDEENQLP